MKIRWHRTYLLILGIQIVQTISCDGYVWDIKRFSGPDIQGNLKTQIYICSDNHYVGTKKQNLEQLMGFFNTLSRAPYYVHTISESMFFRRFFVNQGSNFESYFAKTYGLGNYSFTHSPQDLKATTFIGWELPISYMSLLEKNSLPNELKDSNIENTDNKQFSMYCCDPRLDAESACNLENYIQDFFLEFKKYCSHRASKNFVDSFDGIISSIISMTKAQNPSNPPLTDKYIKESLLFDLDVITHLLQWYQDAETKSFAPYDQLPIKIVIFCGQWHANQLTEMLKLLGFTPEERRGAENINQYVDADGVTLQDKAAQSLAKIFDFIVSSAGTNGSPIKTKTSPKRTDMELSTPPDSAKRRYVAKHAQKPKPYTQQVSQ